MTRSRAKKPVSPFVEFRLEGLKKEFDEQARLFQVMMDPKRGGGLRCVGMLDCLRALNTLYANIAAHEYVLDSIKS